MKNKSQMGAVISPIEDIVADMAAGRMVVLVDEEDRENEGDLVLAADHVTPQAINFMAKFGRGLICLTLSRACCEKLKLPPMVPHNRGKYGTAFTVSIEAALGVTTGISAADRARTIQAAVAPHAVATDLVQPGHIFPLQAVDGGVLMRAGHTEAGCDLAALAGCSPASVICEIMKDDGEMARLPDLQVFAAEHGLKIGTIADLIAYRSRTESLVKRHATRLLKTAWGEFVAHAYVDSPSQSVHLALVKGAWEKETPVLVRVHEPLSLLDVLDIERAAHSWSLHQALSHITQAGAGVAVLLNCGESHAALLEQFQNAKQAQGVQMAQSTHLSVASSSVVVSPDSPADAPGAPQTTGSAADLRTYGIGAQILQDCGVRKMILMASPRRMPSMMGYGLEVVDYLQKVA